MDDEALKAKRFEVIDKFTNDYNKLSEEEKAKAREDILKYSPSDSEETLKRVDATLKREGNLLNGEGQTINYLAEIDKMIDDMNNRFQAVLTGIAEKLTGTITMGPDARWKHLQKTLKKQPQKITAKEAGRLAAASSKLFILTGAGISKASGIPTFRDLDGYWMQKYGNFKDPKEVATSLVLKEDPRTSWKWHYDLLKTIEEAKPNPGHYGLLKVHELSISCGKECTFITQNIDNLQTELARGSEILYPEGYKEKEEGTEGFGFTDKIIEVHGNLKYMRCFRECEGPLLHFTPKPTPLLLSNTSFPTCKICSFIMHPHCLLFDETYVNHLYFRDLIEEAAKIADCMIVVGTTLETNLPLRVVQDYLERGGMVIEFNTVSAIKGGNANLVLGPSEDLLPQFATWFEDYLINSEKIEEDGWKFGVGVIPESDEGEEGIIEHIKHIKNCDGHKEEVKEESKGDLGKVITLNITPHNIKGNIQNKAQYNPITNKKGDNRPSGLQNTKVSASNVGRRSVTTFPSKTTTNTTRKQIINKPIPKRNVNK